MREGQPIRRTPVDIRFDRLPITVKNYVLLDRQAADAKLSDQARSTFGHQATEALGKFSKMDQSSLMEFMAFRRQYEDRTRPRLQFDKK